MAKRTHSTGERHKQLGRRKKIAQRGRRTNDSNDRPHSPHEEARGNENRRHRDSNSQNDFGENVDEYRAEQMPHGFQGKGFFGSGQEVPFQRSQPHLGMGHGVGYTPQPNAGLGYRGLGPKGYSRSDERLLEEINERLTLHDDLDASEISVAVEKREVTLNGTVSSREEKRLAEDIAEDVTGIDHVQNNLRVQRQKS